MNKYRANKILVDNIMFDSQREARRWLELRMLEKAGQIECLKRQVEYELAPAVKITGEKKARPAMKYIADFEYIEGRKLITEDVKGMVLPVFRLKQHLMAHVHGIHVRVVK